MPGKRSTPSVWAHRGTFVVGSIVVLMCAWAFAGAWMLFGAGAGAGDADDEARTSATGEVPAGPDEPAEAYGGHAAMEVADAPILWPRNARPVRASAAPPGGPDSTGSPTPTAPVPTPTGTTAPPPTTTTPEPVVDPEPVEPEPEDPPVVDPEPTPEPPPPEDDHPGKGKGPGPRSP